MDKESAIEIVEGYYKAMLDKYIREEYDTPDEKGELYGLLKGYVKDKHIILHYAPTLAGCILSTVLFPIGVVLDGLTNYKSTWENMVVKVWYAEEKGNFSGDDVYERNNGDDTFKKLLAAAKFK